MGRAIKTLTRGKPRANSCRDQNRRQSAANRAAAKPRSPASDDRYKRYLMLQGVRQTRSVCGNVILLLGRAFQEGGLPFKTTKDALLDLSQAAAGKPRKRNTKTAAG
jgi:hypothetical protein